MKLHVLVVLVVGVLIAADAPRKEAKDQEQIQGKWKMVSSEKNGQQREVRVTQVVIKANTITFVGPDGKASFDVAYTLDANKKPRAIDIKNEKGDETSPGIYSLDGDTLKICTARPGMERPTEFATRPDSHLSLIVLMRDKK